LSSNPSIGSSSYDQYLRATWDDESTIAYFAHRFGGHRLSSVEQGIYHTSAGASRSTRGIRYWIAVRARAAELLGTSPSEVVAGTDYALTEAVRCKSRNEFGVSEALATCVGEYLGPTLTASVASVIVVLGATAKRAFCGAYNIEADRSLLGPMLIGGRQRMVVFLPHPTGYAPRKTFSGCLHPSEMERLREWLKSTSQLPTT
jgi:hypothetical protein